MGTSGRDVFTALEMSVVISSIVVIATVTVIIIIIVIQYLQVHGTEAGVAPGWRLRGVLQSKIHKG